MRSLVFLSAALLLVAPLAAQESQVRWNSAGSPQSGKVVSTDPSGLVEVSMAGRTAPLWLRPDTIPSLAVLVRAKHSRGYSAGIGALLGGALGAATGFALSGGGCGASEWCIVTPSQVAGGLGAIGVVAGAVIGGLSGEDDKWLPWEKRETVARFRPVVGVNLAGAPRVGLRVAF